MAEKTAENNYNSFICKKQGEMGAAQKNCDKVIKNENKGLFFCMDSGKL